MVWTYCLCEKVFPRYNVVLRDLLSLICRLFEDDTISGLLAMRFPTPLCFLKYSEIPPFKPYTGLHWSIYRSGWQWRAGLCVLYRLCAHALVGVKWYAVFCWCPSKCVRERVRERGRGGEGGGRLFHLYEWISKALITSMAEDVVKLKCLTHSCDCVWFDRSKRHFPLKTTW